MSGKFLCPLGQCYLAHGLFAVAVLSGCESKSGVGFVPVRGTVTVDGKPLPAGAAVSFRPDATKGNSTNHIPSSAVDAQGKYELITATRNGAPPGWYKVAVFPPAPAQRESPIVPLPVHQKYGRPETTDLSIEVKPNAPPGAYDIQLQPS